MAAQFPGAVKTFTTKNAGDTIQSIDIDDLQDEVNAIEDGYLNGKAPLNSSKSTLATLSVIGNSTLASSITIGIVPYQFPAAAPTSSGQALVCTSTGTPNVLGWQNITQSQTVRVLNSTLSEQLVSNTALETSVYDYAISSGTVSSAQSLRLTLSGSYLNATAVNQTLCVAVKLGGTVIAGSTGTAIDGGGGFGADVNRHSFWLQTLINANAATNSQRALTRAWVGSVQAAEPAWAGVDVTKVVTSSGLAIDMTAAQTLSVTVKHGNANSSLQFRRFAAITELLG